MKNRLTDSQGRTINYLRLSVTDRCNLNCSYCSPLNKNKALHKDILSYEEMIRLAKLYAENGIEKIRLTGGEPLMRKDLYFLISELKKISRIKEVTLTTNATLLSDQAENLKKAGINRINISLDTLNPLVFRKITGKNLLSRVIQGIDSAIEYEMNPLKINTVLLNKINASEIRELAALSLKKPVHVRFIELMPMGSSNFHDKHKLSMKKAKNIIEQEFGILEKIKSEPFSGPASMYAIKKAKGKIGFIHPMTSHFCAACNRIRITANGFLRPCLLEDSFFDLKTHMRNGASNEELLKITDHALLKKSSVHEILPLVKTEMVSIGG